MKVTGKLVRSWMFVPGHRQRMIDKALGLDVDAIMLDIEDGVAESEKDTARRLIAGSLDRVAENQSFVNELTAGLVFLAQPSRAGLRAALVEPAELVGAGFENRETRQALTRCTHRCTTGR